MKTNVAVRNMKVTYEGGMAAPAQKPEVELERAVTNCLLFENTFYEKGSDIAGRIHALAAQCPAEFVSLLAARARQNLGLRHVSLWLALDLVRRGGPLVASTLEAVIQRADEPAELLALYWRDGRKPLSAQLKKGMARAFSKFSPYALAKYNRDGRVKLRDVLFLCHAKPKDEEQAAVWKKLVEGTLEAPDTWEVALSAGKDKKETWTRLLAEGKLGALAFLRNLRNMDEAGVSHTTIAAYAAGSEANKIKWRGVLPWQFISAAKTAPWAEPFLETAMLAGLEGAASFSGSTALVVDVSGSMNCALSSKGYRTRLDAASAMAIFLREACAEVDVLTFSEQLVLCPPRRGFALSEIISQSQDHRGTFLANALLRLRDLRQELDRIVVVTDEQAADGIAPCWAKHGYIVNVAPYKPALDTSGSWVRISGWSDRIPEWIAAQEKSATRLDGRLS